MTKPSFQILMMISSSNFLPGGQANEERKNKERGRANKETPQRIESPLSHQIPHKQSGVVGSPIAGVYQPRSYLLPLFTRVRGSGILRSSAVVSSSRKPAPTVLVLSLGGGSSASQAPYLLYDSRRRRHLVEHRLGSRLQDLLQAPGPYAHAQYQNRDAGIRPVQLNDQLPTVPVG